MATISLTFLEVLKNKLSFGSTRSILLNCLPGKLTSRLPLNDLDHIKKNFSTDFIQKLTTELDFDMKFSIKYVHTRKDEPNENIDPNHEINKRISLVERRLSSIKYDHEDIQKELGVETFGFGFPLIILKNHHDSSKLIVAPLLIWQLDIKQSYDHQNSWVISRKPDSSILTNDALRSYLNAEFKLDIPALPEHMTEDGIIEKIELEKYIKDVKAKLNISDPKELDWTTVETIPEKGTIQLEEGYDSKIILNGVFGIYKSQKQSLINDINRLIEQFGKDPDAEKEKVQQEWGNRTSPIEIDPSQHAVLRSLTNKDKIVIQGPPGTGKSQTLTAIIATALADKKKVLVVCEKRTALEVIHGNLIKKYPFLERSLALIEDISKDRNVLVKNAREREINPDKVPMNLGLMVSLEKENAHFEKIIDEIDKKYLNLRLLIEDDKRWIDFVAEWISLNVEQNSIQELEWLSTRLNFITEENTTSAVSTKIKQLHYLYVQTESTIPEFDMVFCKDINPNSFENIPYEIRNLSFELKSALLGLSTIYEVYGKTIERKAEVHFNLINTLAKRYLTLVNELNGRLKNPLKPSFFEKIILLFKKEGNQIKNTSLEAGKVQAELIEAISGLVKEDVEKMTANEIHQHVESQKTFILKSFIDRFYAEQDLELSELKNLDASEWTRLCELLYDTIANLSTILEISEYHTNAYNIRERVSAWIKLGEYIQGLYKRESEYEKYLTWRGAFENTEISLRNFIYLLIGASSKNWGLDFDKISLYKLLSHVFRTKKMPENESDLLLIEDLKNKIASKQNAIIRENLLVWFNDGIFQLDKSTIGFRKLYNLRGMNGESRNSLRKIINFDHNAFTDMHPLVLANPTSVSALFPLASDIFDLVIFDEASQLRIEDTFAALIRGKSVIISGDSQQMPPSGYFESNRTVTMIPNGDDFTDEDELLLDQTEQEMATKESLLEWAIDEGYQETYLDMHYRSKHPDLIEFSNTCFYKSRLIPMPGTIKEAPIVFQQVNGLYENRTNQKEAEQVIQLIKNEIPSEKSLGIATFNLTQRNLILDMITKERFSNPVFNKKMVELELNGFFVKNLENIQGDERDIIIISTTFGERRDGKFLMNFGPVSQKNGYRLLNVIITRAKEKLYMLTSIPEEKQHQCSSIIQSELKVSGKSGLLAYLLYCKYVSDGNVEMKEGLLRDIRMKIADATEKDVKNDAVEQSRFELEVYKMLRIKLQDHTVISDYACGGFKIGVVVINETSNKKIAIAFDGAAYHSDELIWHHDIYRQAQLEKEGFIIHRIWSANWWKNPVVELEKLVEFLLLIKA